MRYVHNSKNLSRFCLHSSCSLCFSRVFFCGPIIGGERPPQRREFVLSVHSSILMRRHRQLRASVLHTQRTSLRGAVPAFKEVAQALPEGLILCLNECNGKLFAGLRGAEDFRMLWSSSDGKVWTAFNTSEIGERTVCDGVIAFGNYLYITTRDTYPWMGWQEPRLEVWRYGAKYEPAHWLEELDDLRPRVHPIGPLPPGR